MIDKQDLQEGALIGPALTVFAAMVVIPFYLGAIHMPIVRLLIYCPIAGIALMAGTQLYTLQGDIGRSWGAILTGVGVWTFSTMVVGAASYLVALIF